MSYDTHNTWLYRLEGRYIHLWQYIDGATTDTLGDYRIKLPNEYYGKQLIYPDEDITNGLRIEYTALIEPFVDEAWEDLSARVSSSAISFSTQEGDSFINGSGLFGDFMAGDKIRVIGSASNDGDYVIATKTDSLLGVSSIVVEDVGESITIYQIPDEDASPSETSHLNLNRMLSLATVDFLKAQLADRKGDVQMKEYYMREFWKKVGDNNSNKRKISMSFPMSPYGVR